MERTYIALVDRLSRTKLINNPIEVLVRSREAATLTIDLELDSLLVGSILQKRANDGLALFLRNFLLGPLLLWVFVIVLLRQNDLSRDTACGDLCAR